VRIWPFAASVPIVEFAEKCEQGAAFSRGVWCRARAGAVMARVARRSLAAFGLGAVCDIIMSAAAAGLLLLLVGVSSLLSRSADSAGSGLLDWFHPAVRAWFERRFADGPTEARLLLSVPSRSAPAVHDRFRFDRSCRLLVARPAANSGRSPGCRLVAEVGVSTLRASRLMLVLRSGSEGHHCRIVGRMQMRAVRRRETRSGPAGTTGLSAGTPGNRRDGGLPSRPA